MFSVQHFRERDAHARFAVENIEAGRGIVNVRLS